MFKLKEKEIRGKIVEFAESAREMRSMLSAYPTQLLAQPGSAIAICQTDEYDTLDEWTKKMPFVWRKERKEFVANTNFRILVQYRQDNGLYSLVGGARKLCESFEETAHRELGEETSIALEELLFLGMISGGDEMVNIYPDGNAAEGLDALYLAMVPKGTVTRPDKETLEFLWLSPDEICEKVDNKQWHPAQERTVDILLDSLLLLPELWEIHKKRAKFSWR